MPDIFTYIKKETLAQTFSCKFYEIFEDTFFYRIFLSIEHHWWLLLPIFIILSLLLFLSNIELSEHVNIKKLFSLSVNYSQGDSLCINHCVNVKDWDEFWNLNWLFGNLDIGISASASALALASASACQYKYSFLHNINIL